LIKITPERKREIERERVMEVEIAREWAVRR